MPLLLEAGEEGGFENLVWHKVHLRSGIYMFKGALTNFHLSQRFDLKYTDLNEVTGNRGVYNMGRNFSIKLIIPFSN